MFSHQELENAAGSKPKLADLRRLHKTLFNSLYIKILLMCCLTLCANSRHVVIKSDSPLTPCAAQCYGITSSLHSHTHFDLCIYSHYLHDCSALLGSLLDKDVCQCCDVRTHSSLHSHKHNHIHTNGCAFHLELRYLLFCLSLTFSFSSPHTLWMNPFINNKCLTGI